MVLSFQLMPPVPVSSVPCCFPCLCVCLADVWLTGELSHHNCIAAASEGTTVILTNHSNTERGYLPVLRQRIIEKLGSEVSVEISVSETDSDPLVVV